MEDPAFDQLLRDEAPRVLAFARRGCGDGSHAEDVVQETFLLAFRARHQLLDPTRARSWLLTIARRVCQRMHRGRVGEPVHLEPLADGKPLRGARLAELLAEAPNGFDARMRQEARELVEAAICRVPQPFRSVLVLFDVAELSLAEVASVLGLKEATVKTRLHRGRLKLRAVLVEQLPPRPACHGREICLDLLRAKLDALDRRVVFPYSTAQLCERCREHLAVLDLAAGVCPMLAVETMPEHLRQRLSALS